MVQDTIATLQADVDKQILDADALKAGLMAKKEMLSGLAGEVESEKKAATDAAYDQGVKDAQEAAGNPGGKVYSLEEANALIAEAVAPKDTQIAELSSQMEVLSARVAELEAKPDADAAVAAFKAELKAQYEAQQVAESAGETGFAGLLG